MNAAFSYTSLVSSKSKTSQGQGWLQDARTGLDPKLQFPLILFCSSLRPQIRSKGLPFREYPFILVL